MQVPSPSTATMCRSPPLASPSYHPLLGVKDTQRGIQFVKHRFPQLLAEALNLQRASAPLMVPAGSGINDDLNGERPVSFTAKCFPASANCIEIVQSLAKWKRLALAEYGFRAGEGIYTDMNAIRPNEDLDELHSLYVDQWDWELVMKDEKRTVSFLKDVVRRIYGCLMKLEEEVHAMFPQLPRLNLPRDITFVHTEELEQRWPDKTPKQRESMIVAEKGAVFLGGIGAPLPLSKVPHDGRAPDYDDWSSKAEWGPGLNGDILVRYHPTPGAFCMCKPTVTSSSEPGIAVCGDTAALELSSMGIRVSPSSLRSQLAQLGLTSREELMWHKKLLAGELPQTVGGGIGQSRLCMFMLHKAHVGEVQTSVWPTEMVSRCRNRGIILL